MNIFDNPQFKRAKESMSPTTRKKYEKEGKYLFETLNFGEEKVESSIEACLIQKEALLRSGLHPDDLSQEDQEFMESVKGKDWKKEWIDNDE